MKSILPEIEAGGYSRFDGTVEFYGRINSLLLPDDIVVDYGAGRGSRFLTEPEAYRTRLSRLRGKCRRVIGVDIDPVVRENPGVDEAYVIKADMPLPFTSGSCGMLIADFVLEHIRDPVFFVDEVFRILRPNGWFCARTPNRWGYVAVGARIVPSFLETKILEIVQPDRSDVDVFPKFYRLNCRANIHRHLSGRRFKTIVYAPITEPAYVPRTPMIQRAALIWEHIVPEWLRNNIFLFARKI
jgi:SAM-dependent methyltransferase